MEMMMMVKVLLLVTYISMALLISLVSSSVVSMIHHHQDRKIFIAYYMGSLPVPDGKYSPSSHHSQIIKQIVHPSFASDIDTRIVDKLLLGNDAVLVGNAINALPSSDGKLPLVYEKELRQEILESKFHIPAAALVATFSSRGPMRFIHDIVKPDVTAPGVKILATFSPFASPSGSLLDKSVVKYRFLSETSMACPHVGGVAAFVKYFHPDWSSFAIKYVLITTAWEMNAALNLNAEFAFGYGHIDSLRDINSGLVYETSIQEYLHIWCNISRRNGSLTASNCLMKLNVEKSITHLWWFNYT